MEEGKEDVIRPCIISCNKANLLIFSLRLAAIVAQSGPSMISLAGGMPNPNLFPFQEAEFKLRWVLKYFIA